jgi:hypothetical protein
MVDNKIFSIGFGKCATRTINLFLRKNLNTSVHGGRYMKHWFLTGNISRIQNRARCYIYDSMVDPFNIDFTLKIYPNSYYILPTRNFVNWFISAVIECKYLVINPKILHDFLSIRNNYYAKLQSLKIKNFRIIDIEKEDICKALVSFLPEDTHKYTKKSIVSNRTPSLISNKEDLKTYVLSVMNLMNIGGEAAQSNMIVYDNQKNYSFEIPNALTNPDHPLASFNLKYIPQGEETKQEIQSNL